MPTTLNVKVGSKITVRLTSGAEVDVEVVELPKIIRVKDASGQVYDVRPEDVLVDERGQSGGRFAGRLNQARL